MLPTLPGLEPKSPQLPISGRFSLSAMGLPSSEPLVKSDLANTSQSSSQYNPAETGKDPFRLAIDVAVGAKKKIDTWSHNTLVKQNISYGMTPQKAEQEAKKLEELGSTAMGFIGGVGEVKNAKEAIQMGKGTITKLIEKGKKIFTKGVSETIGKGASKLPEAIPTQATIKLGQELPSPISRTVPQVSEVLSSKTRIPSMAEKSMGTEVSGAVDRLNELIKTAIKPSKQTLQKLYETERAKRTGAIGGIFEQGAGQKGYFQALGKLKGELAPASKKSFQLGDNLVEKDINSLFKAAQTSPVLNVYDKLNTQTALTKVLSGTIPTSSELTLLEKTFGSKLVDTVLGQRSTGQKIIEGLGQIANLPRTIMASFDLSAPFRQGLMLTSHPKSFFGAFKSMFKQFGSEKAFIATQESIARMPEFNMMKESKLALTDMGKFLTNREEKFMSSWAEKIPGVGSIVKASNRAYTGFLNKLRADVFTDIVKGVKASNGTVDETMAKKIADFVNAASGRGRLLKVGELDLEKAAIPLNGIFFSPRLMASRLHFLNPVNYVKADPLIRKEMLKSMFTIAGSGATLLGLAKLAGAEVGTEPNSSDFGKIIVGNTRVDIWGGFQQYVRMANQLISGKYVSTTTGKEMMLGEGYKPLTRYDILMRQVESKEAPVLSFVTDLLRQQDYQGKPISIPKEIASRFIPMAIGDMYSIAKDNPELIPLSVLGVFGGSLQTYKPVATGGLGGLERTMNSSSKLPGLGGQSLPKLPGL